MVIKSHTPLLTYGIDDAIDDLVLPNISRFDSFQTSIDHEEDFAPQFLYTPTLVEDIVYDNVQLIKLHHLVWIVWNLVFIWKKMLSL